MRDDAIQIAARIPDASMGRIEVRPLMGFDSHSTSSRTAIEAMFREKHGLVVAGLARYLVDLELAKDALQDACLVALDLWSN